MKREVAVKSIGLLTLTLVAALVGACSASSVHEAGFSASNLEATSTASPAMAATDVRARAVDTVEVQQAVAQLTSAATPGSTAYRIGALDVLDVSVFKVPDLSKSVQVSDIGTVNLPLVGEIQAAGRTAREVEQELTALLGKKYLQNPQVTVFVKEYNSQHVTLEGAVSKPGVYPIKGGMSLLQALATASGASATSDETALVFRSIEGKRTAARFDLAQVRSGAAEDPALQAGDVVVVNSSAIKEAFGNIVKALPIASVFAAL